MFNVEFLNMLRDAETAFIVKEFPAGAKVLEIGGGTGQQAKLLHDHGFDVTSVDLAGSLYADDRVYDILEYDGKTLPLPDDSFDVVFSSSVLEHIPHLDDLHKEFARVCKPDGVMIHVVPRHTWRIVTSISHYITLWTMILLNFRHYWGKTWWPHRLLIAFYGNLCRAWRLIREKYLPERHGERGNVLTEIYYFHPAWWRRHFKKNNFIIIEDKQTEFLYSGDMVLGKRLSFPARRKLAKVFGASCHLFRLKVDPSS
jgi:ubiquinone/menaquinone biosynthesis C-methylase UbiE